MRKRIEYLLKKALEAVPNAEIPNARNEIDEAYNGAIASLGASLIQMGLLPTLAVYAADDKKDKADKKKLMKAILLTLGRPEADGRALLVSASQLQHQSEKNRLIQDINDASVALKLVIRTFKLVKNGTQN